MPETTFTFRVDQELKRAFTEAARANDRPGSQLLRDFMRDYVQRAEHDAWFRAEVEQSLKEAADPNVELIPHEEVVRKWKARRAELITKVKRERGREDSLAAPRNAISKSSLSISVSATQMRPRRARCRNPRTGCARYPYIIVYAVGADYVRIHRVLHSAQRWPPRR
jgi:predicted transcriptional regulator